MNNTHQLPPPVSAPRLQRPQRPETRVPEPRQTAPEKLDDRRDGVTETTFPGMLESRREVPPTRPTVPLDSPESGPLQESATKPNPVPAGVEAVTVPGARESAASKTVGEVPLPAQVVKSVANAYRHAISDPAPASDAPAQSTQGPALRPPGLVTETTPTDGRTPMQAAPRPDLPLPSRPAPGTLDIVASTQQQTGPKGEAPASPAPVATMPAVTLETVVKGSEAYGQKPVVGEAQILPTPVRTPVDLPQTPSPNAATEPVGAPPGATEGEADSAQTGEPTAPPAKPVGAAPSPELPGDTGIDKDSTLETVSHPDDAADGTTTTPAPPSVTSDAPARPVQAASGTLTTAAARQVQQQVARQVTSRLPDLSGQEKVTLRLNPESLGQVELNFEAKADRLTVVISASNAESEKALRENTKDLSDRIIERSSRFSHVEIRVDVKDGAEPRQDNKQDGKQDGRQEQRREQNRQDGSAGQENRHPHAQRQQRAWESAMSWQLADATTSEEG